MRKRKDTVKMNKETRAVLLERSRLDYRRNDIIPVTEFSTPPELGHGSARLKIGYGRNEDEFFEEISIRPAYHDLLAKDTGYSKDSQILFLQINARYYNKTRKTKLDSFKIIDIISLTPYDLLFKKKSWKLSIGVDTIKDLDCGYCNSLKVNYGIGLSYKPSHFSPLLIYSFIDADFEQSGHLEPDYR